MSPTRAQTAERAPETLPEQVRPAAAELAPRGLTPIAGLVHGTLRRTAPVDSVDPLGGTAVEPGIATALSRRRGKGAPLNGELAASLGEHYGTDLSGVRVHTDREADTISRSVQAVAFSYGSDVYFSNGSYSPATSSGQRLLAHELAHVAQQGRSSSAAATSGPMIGRANDPAEAEADKMADGALSAIRRQATRTTPHAPGHVCPSCAGGAATHRRTDPVQRSTVGALRRQASLVGAPVIRREGFFGKLWNKISGGAKKPKTDDTKTETGGGWSQGAKPGRPGGESGFTLGDRPKIQGPQLPGLGERGDLVGVGVQSGVQAVGEQVQDGKVGYPKDITIGKDKIRVESADEELEAETIIAEMQTKYGITLSGQKTIDGIKGSYGEVPAEELQKLSTSVWQMKELRAFQYAMSKYAPILGEDRKTSTLAKFKQGVTTIGKLKNAIDEDSPEGKLDDSTLGETFRGTSNVALFDSITEYVNPAITGEGRNAPDNETTIRKTAIHEMAHALIEPLYLQSFINASNYWADFGNVKTGTKLESPPSPYGETSAAEDLCESFGFYFLSPTDFKAACPKRHAFVQGVIKGWKPVEKKQVIDGVKKAPGNEKQEVGVGTGGGKS